MTVLAFFQWWNDCWLGVTVRESTWLFPTIEIFHLLSLAVLGGTIIAVDLKLLGIGLGGVPVSRLSRDVRPLMDVSLVVVIVSGIALFASEALRCYENPAFWWKMGALVLAIVFTYAVRARWTSHPTGSVSSARGVALVSLLLWTNVAAAGRGIGFY